MNANFMQLHRFMFFGIFNSVKQCWTCYCEAAPQNAAAHHQRLFYRTTCSTLSLVCDSLKFQMKQQKSAAASKCQLCQCSLCLPDRVVPAALIWFPVLHGGTDYTKRVIWWANKVSLPFSTTLSASCQLNHGCRLRANKASVSLSFGKWS